MNTIDALEVIQSSAANYSAALESGTVSDSDSNHTSKVIDEANDIVWKDIVVPTSGSKVDINKRTKSPRNYKMWRCLILGSHKYLKTPLLSDYTYKSNYCLRGCGTCQNGVNYASERARRTT